MRTLQPYLTDPPTPTDSPPLIKSATPTLTATATSTPVTYQVKANNDMFGIAFRYGISPQALMTANPSVNPRAMDPGTLLIIPVTLTPAVSANTPTPPGPSPTAIVSIPGGPDCYLATDGGVWCFLMASGEVTLALPLPAKDTRYLQVTIRDQQVASAVDGKSAGVTGHLALPAGQKPASQVWVAAAAFDAGGAVVGVRKWEAASVLSPGGTLSFDLQVYTLGPLIDHVSLLAQARP